jgi:hypothetical protein
MKRNNIFSLIVIAFLSVTFLLSAEDKKDEPVSGWQNDLLIGFNFSQTQFSNWSKGGENIVNWQLNILGSFDYIQKAYIFDSDLKIQYGRNINDAQGERKTVDEIRADLVYNYNIWKGYFSPYAAARFISQMDYGYSYTDTSRTTISALFDPAYTTEAIGFSYTPSKMFKADMGFSAKQTITDKYYTYADDPNTPEIETLKNEMGMELVMDLTWPFYEKMAWKSKMISFSNLKGIDEIDVNWDNVVIIDISDWFNVNFQFQLIYDKDVSAKRQLRQALSIGINYALLKSKKK